MSVYETSWLVIDLWLPKILYSGDSITARTSLLLQLVLLFSTSLTVEVNAKTGTVTLVSRNWWFNKRAETVLFGDIRYIDTSKITVGTSAGYTPDGIGFQDQQENFVPFLMTHDGRKIDLISFYGPGSVSSGWWGVVLGDSVLDFKGRQEIRAMEFCERVATMVGVTCGVDSKILTDTKSTAGKIECSSCGHFNASNCRKCLYCGADMSR